MIGLKAFASPYVYHAWIASAAVPPDILFRTLEAYGEPAAYYDSFMRHDPEAQAMVPQRFHQALETNGTRENLTSAGQVLAKTGIRAFACSEEGYPDSLANIPDPPGILFYLGNPGCLSRRTISIVGSRAASYAGQKATRKLARDLSARGVSVISGLACGIDAAAHWGCIDGGSPTCAVMGCGLDRVYPSDNAGLREEILKRDGLLLSEYLPGEKPAGWHFPFRNRILAGLGEALVLMEAKIRSGSMTSVQHALNQGKDVFVYPGDPASPLCEGNHQLLREGAIYFTSAEDILEDLGWLDNQPIIGQNIDCSIEKRADSPAEKAVVQALIPGPLGFGELAEKTGLDPSQLMCALTVLQIHGSIESLPGKIYQLKE